MQVSKRIINNARNTLKTDLSSNEQMLIETDRILELMENGPRTEEDKIVISKFMQEHMGKITISYGEFKDKILKIKSERARRKTIIEGLSYEGIKKVTYELPRLPLACIGYDPEFSYLMVTGIKTNAKLKQEESPLMNDIERELLDFERRMGQYISDDYKIDLNHLCEFFTEYQAYLRTYVEKVENQHNNIDLARVLNTTFLNLANYNIRTHTGLNLSMDDIKEIGVEYAELIAIYSSEGVMLGDIYDIICRKIIEEYNVQYEVLKSGINPEDDVSIEFYTEELTLEDYLKDGRIVKSCNLTSFVALLIDSGMNMDDVLKYRSMMERFMANKVIEIYDGKVQNSNTSQGKIFDNLLEKRVKILARKVIRRHIQEINVALQNEQTAQEKPATEVVETVDPVLEYLENGVVSKECDLELFKQLLNESNYSQERKFELMNQMKNLKNRNVQAEYERKMEEVRTKVFSEDDRVLYFAAKANSKANSKIEGILEDIDYLLEDLLKDSSEEAITIVSSELAPLFIRLNDLMKPKVESAKTEKVIPKVSFFKEKTYDEDGNETATPKILSNIIASQKGNYKQAYIQLNKLFNGITSGDKIVQGANLPCKGKIWIKGRDFKVSYTLIGDIVVIIDGFKGEEGFTKVINTVKTKDFLEYWKDLQISIANSNLPDETTYINMVMDELSKSGSVKKLVKP